VGKESRTVESLEMNLNFWRGKRVLLTGHTGFKGSWLALWLHEAGAIVGGYSLPPSSVENLFELADVGSSVDSVYADIRDLPELQSQLNRFQPEIVFHLAAQALVRHSYEAPIETYQVNVMGTANVLEAVRQCSSCRVVLVVTSDKCYENREWNWGYRNATPWAGMIRIRVAKAARNSSPQPIADRSSDPPRSAALQLPARERGTS